MGFLSETWLFGYYIYSYYMLATSWYTSLVTFLSCFFGEDWFDAMLVADDYRESFIAAYI